jgi:hypothetical protein
LQQCVDLPIALLAKCTMDGEAVIATNLCFTYMQSLMAKEEAMISAMKD